MQDEAKKDAPINGIEELKKKSEAYLNNWKRSAADFINYKKEEMERAGMLAGYVKEGMFLNMLPIIDSMYLAVAAFGKDGFMPVQKQIEDFLKKEGIKEITVMGQKFDPNSMEIMEEVSGGPTSAESGVVTEELQKGYKMGERVLRPAKVRVIK
ncbi:MAG: nucleotide exchange factor GrpE [Candidatus Staskawiczbacteria bacterium RIFCSPHIGHO2_02_FULL_43_16]|uniref:Protein GrpE n=1 Tax=Candidatus Staskawiczbacteria bacterium RIFCSPHIGHO2_01_FULL_41_41 TaxID=1802203 RepID=A0A1G2HUV4_9BACT|nr:MAG: nucleotide exchange factor GrpE [Candidatus Staskawiczbacteria bacterium RIFCSPHIGHO2_01_FULL_41_41]OGZ68845.1 MAG: nucleotide exchange factor GrpE [Candidatus Staskawiczbacteria bacterium RIFCSPHIGHO2_02_FULL_43_16]OGZ74218.1 MAG: nucleotide exchange factor GrpE [Candidatus Staskawiczbacteria bacterium RIFCSPLOWO2_01_FULL_43_17b]